MKNRDLSDLPGLVLMVTNLIALTSWTSTHSMNITID